eukprot:10081353-Ditylum_brightwellii.AAC.1
MKCKQDIKTVHLLLVLSLLHNWQTRQVDFIVAYPPVPIECDLWMRLPAGIETKHGNNKTHMLKLENNLYGQKQAGQVWNHYLSQKMFAIGFKQSKVDEYGSIFAGPSNKGIYEAIQKLKRVDLDINYRGHLDDYLGLSIVQREDLLSSQGGAIIHLSKYLASTKDAGLILDPKAERIFEVHADTDFIGNWYKSTAANDASTSKSRSGYVVSYAGCPIFWASKLQMQVMLSTCKAEYVALSTALCDVIPMMQLLEEMQQEGIAIDSAMSKVYCKAFKDNTEVLELAKAPKMRPHMKHINAVYHHF